jgi:hypothetical protein
MKNTLVILGLSFFTFASSASAGLTHEILCRVKDKQGKVEFNGVTIELTLTEELQALESAPMMLTTTGIDQDDVYNLSVKLDGSISLTDSLNFTVVETGGADVLPNPKDKSIYNGVRIEVTAEKSDSTSPAFFKFTKQNGKVILRNGTCNVLTQGSPVVE